jgi:hypothetical protein
VRPATVLSHFCYAEKKASQSQTHRTALLLLTARRDDGCDVVGKAMLPLTTYWSPAHGEILAQRGVNHALTDALQFLETEAAGVGGSRARGGEGGGVGGIPVGLAASSSALTSSAGGAGGATLVPRFSPADLKLAAAHQGLPYGTKPSTPTQRRDSGYGSGVSSPSLGVGDGGGGGGGGASNCVHPRRSQAIFCSPASLCLSGAVRPTSQNC